MNENSPQQKYHNHRNKWEETHFISVSEPIFYKDIVNKLYEWEVWNHRVDTKPKKRNWNSTKINISVMRIDSWHINGIIKRSGGSSEPGLLSWLMRLYGNGVRSDRIFVGRVWMKFIIIDVCFGGLPTTSLFIFCLSDTIDTFKFYDIP